MSIVIRWLRRGLLVLLGLLILAVAGVWLWAAGTVPGSDDAYRVEPLEAPVQLLLDPHGIPHIFAATEADAYRALGWLHARDRFAQMDSQRRIGQGRLAEAIGPSVVRFDRLMRTLGLYRRAETTARRTSGSVREALEAYAEGVNAWLASPDRSLPPEYALLPEPEPWVPADSIVWGQLMALQLSGDYRQELRLAALDEALPAELIDWFYPPGLGSDPATIPLAETEAPEPPTEPPTGADEPPAEEADDAAGSPGDSSRLLEPGLARSLLASLPPPLGPDSASNAWVVHGDRTATGAPVLANDPHLGLAAPILWYLARIETPTFRLAGATVPGVPYVVLGHNTDIAWGLTTTNADTQDLFVERIDPDDPDRYRTPAGFVEMTVREETIEVAGAEPVTIRIRSTRHGPVISDLELDGTAAFGGDTALALAWPALGEVDTTAEALHELNRAAGWESFQQALRAWVAPVQNVFYADVAGNIGVMTPGAIPVRRPGHTGDRPVEGWRTGAGWTGMIPAEELPRAFNPATGHLANANNAIVGPGYPYRLARDYDEPFRALRIEQLLAPAADYTLDDATAGQMDTISLGARRLLPLMTRITATGSDSAMALSLLRRWDGAMDRDRPEPLIFATWLRELSRSLFADDLGDGLENAWTSNTTVVARTLAERPELCDDGRTSPVESCEQILAASLGVAIDRIYGRYGAPDDWRWGQAHRAPLDSAIYSRIPLLGEILSIGLETGGGQDTLNRGAGPYRPESVTFAHTHGAGLRAVYDLSDLARSRFVIATGQSGNPWSPHYGDQTQTWRDGGWIELSGRPADLVRQDGWRSVTLQPTSR